MTTIATRKNISRPGKTNLVNNGKELNEVQHLTTRYRQGVRCANGEPTILEENHFWPVDPLETAEDAIKNNGAKMATTSQKLIKEQVEEKHGVGAPRWMHWM